MPAYEWSDDVIQAILDSDQLAEKPRITRQDVRDVLDAAERHIQDRFSNEQPEAAAVVMGRAGVAARNVSLSPQRRAEIARIAAQARWGNKT